MWNLFYDQIISLEPLINNITKGCFDNNLNVQTTLLLSRLFKALKFEISLITNIIENRQVSTEAGKFFILKLVFL